MARSKKSVPSVKTAFRARVLKQILKREITVDEMKGVIQSRPAVRTRQDTSPRACSSGLGSLLRSERKSRKRKRPGTVKSGLSDKSERRKRHRQGTPGRSGAEISASGKRTDLINSLEHKVKETISLYNIPDYSLIIKKNLNRRIEANPNYQNVIQILHNEINKVGATASKDDELLLPPPPIPPEASSGNSPLSVFRTPVQVNQQRQHGRYTPNYMRLPVLLRRPILSLSTPPPSSHLLDNEVVDDINTVPMFNFYDGSSLNQHLSSQIRSSQQKSSQSSCSSHSSHQLEAAATKNYKAIANSQPIFNSCNESSSFGNPQRSTEKQHNPDNEGTNYPVKEALNLREIYQSKWKGNFSTDAQLKNLFPSTSTKFWNSSEKSNEKIDRMGNINLLNDKMIIGEAVRTGLGQDLDDNDLETNYWNDEFDERAPYFVASDDPMDVDERQQNNKFNNVNRLGGGGMEMPITNCHASNLNTWRKKVNTSLAPCRFSKDDLSRVVVIANVDRKFIAAKITSRQVDDTETQMLVLFDQHAVHERILLERLIEESFEETIDGEKTVVAVRFNPPVRMEFANTDVRLIESSQVALGLLGLGIEIIGRTTVSFFAVPKCFREKVEKESDLNRMKTIHRLIRSLVEEQIRHFVQTSSIIQPLPETVMNILRSQACRGAIKFGDELSTDACVQLMNDLKKCKVPFQCAHGRPVVVPLLDITVK